MQCVKTGILAVGLKTAWPDDSLCVALIPTSSLAGSRGITTAVVHLKIFGRPGPVVATPSKIYVPCVETGIAPKYHRNPVFVLESSAGGNDSFGKETVEMFPPVKKDGDAGN